MDGTPAESELVAGIYVIIPKSSSHITQAQRRDLFRSNFGVDAMHNFPLQLAYPRYLATFGYGTPNGNDDNGN